MGKRHAWLPKSKEIIVRKEFILDALEKLDQDPHRTRILNLESAFRNWMDSAQFELPTDALSIEDLGSGTLNPFALLAHAKIEGLTSVSELEAQLKLAKQLSSIETSVGKMLEEVTIPEYGWQRFPSKSQSVDSWVDAMHKGRKVLYIATIKSGPRTLNDSISTELGQSIARHAASLGKRYNCKLVSVTYATLYGTFKQSNKKDWRVLLSAYNELKSLEDSQDIEILLTPEKRKGLVFKHGDTRVLVRLRHGIEWWTFLGSSWLTFLEVGAALIRAAVQASPQTGGLYKEPSHAELAELLRVPTNYNIAILQRNQIEWMLLFVSLFVDKLES
uniref:PmeII family type II restriction endonuclease n=1 Tax=Thermus oshimai TaxID=56957 RepID=UPI0012DE93AB|nr:PmeII family type II restriction endonuclease [Thermus oshimai]